jgi:hypothetical protein
LAWGLIILLEELGDLVMWLRFQWSLAAEGSLRFPGLSVCPGREEDELGRGAPGPCHPPGPEKGQALSRRESRVSHHLSRLAGVREGDIQDVIASLTNLGIRKKQAEQALAQAQFSQGGQP